MFPAKALWKPVVQRLVTGRGRAFRMHPGVPPINTDMDRISLYLHVPFCTSLCPFCPYNRCPYDDDRFERYRRAVKEEITQICAAIGRPLVDSVYVGGGTPTVNMAGLLDILEHMRATFAFDADLCVELHPAHMDDDVLEGLKTAGVTLLSVGVESTDDAILQRIGRSHTGEEALDAVARATRIGFGTVNADLMFALPGQGLAEWQRDVDRVLACGVDQLSTYPIQMPGTA